MLWHGKLSMPSMRKTIYDICAVVLAADVLYQRQSRPANSRHDDSSMCRALDYLININDDCFF